MRVELSASHRGLNVHSEQYNRVKARPRASHFAPDFVPGAREVASSLLLQRIRAPGVNYLGRKTDRIGTDYSNTRVANWRRIRSVAVYWASARCTSESKSILSRSGLELATDAKVSDCPLAKYSKA